MHPIAYYAVAATVLFSALGAFLLCVLVFRFGFEPSEDELVEDRHRRYFVTRLGHAGGAVCFAITAGLAAVALGMPARHVVEMPRPEVTRADLTALRATDGRLDETLRAIADRIARAEASIGDARAEAARAVEAAKAERAAAAARPVATVAPVERRRSPAAKEDARDSKSRPANTPDRRPQPRASVVEPAPATPLAAMDAGNASPVTTEAATEPEQPPVRVAAAPSVRAAAAPPAPELPPIPRSEPRAASTDEADAGHAISRVGSELGRALGRIGRDVRRFIEDLR